MRAQARLPVHTALELCRVSLLSSFMLLHVHRDHKVSLLNMHFAALVPSENLLILNNDVHFAALVPSESSPILNMYVAASVTPVLPILNMCILPHLYHQRVY